MDIVGKMYVYKNQQYGGYSTYVKNNDNEKMYISVGFRKDQDPTGDRAEIDITKGFLSFYKTKEGMAKPKIVVMEYFTNENAFEDPQINALNDLPF